MAKYIKLIIIGVFIVLSFPKLTFADGDNDSIADISERMYLDSVYRFTKDTTAYCFSNNVSYVFVKPKPFSFIKNSAIDLWGGTKSAFTKKTVVPWISVALTSAVFIYFDEEILLGAQRFGRYINLSGESKAVDVSPVKNVPIYLPGDFATSLYYIGDGWTEIAVNGAFYFYGLFAKDTRALRTASQLSEGLITMGIVTQVLKHMTGRQSPFTRTQKGGKWTFFPNQMEYQRNVPHFDAFPSGHLATAMMTVSIIAENYPEKRWVTPLGYTLMGLCGFQMLNNGVHWMGDYPLALAIGYHFAKIATRRGRIIKYDEGGRVLNQPRWFDNIKLRPSYQGPEFGMGLGVCYTFK